VFWLPFCKVREKNRRQSTPAEDIPSHVIGHVIDHSTGAEYGPHTPEMPAAEAAMEGQGSPPPSTEGCADGGVFLASTTSAQSGGYQLLPYTDSVPKIEQC